MKLKRSMYLLVCILYLFTALTAGCTVRTNTDESKKPHETDIESSTSPPVITPAVGSGGDQDDGEPNGENISGPYAKPVFSEERVRKYIPSAYELPSFECRVPAYSTDIQLSNIVNLEQFGEFSQEQREMLAKNGFVVTSGQQEQLFYIYELNEYYMLPSFISTDSVLQVYHVFFDYSLRTLEAQQLLGDLGILTQSMLDKSVYLYESIKNPRVREQALKNIAFFSVAHLALGGEIAGHVPDEAVDYANAEYALMLDAPGFQESPLFGFDMDYSQYKPRGHYTRSEELEKFFKAMMWYGQVPHPLLEENEGEVFLDEEATCRALLMTYALFMGSGQVPDLELWENIYDPTVFYVGSADDLTVYDYKDLLIKVFGEDPDLNTFLDEDKTQKLLEEAKNLPEPQIQQQWISADAPTGKQFRFMGQRYIPDSEILQTLVEPLKRPMPSGLDVMAVLGSEKAYDYLIQDYKVAEQWPEYLERFYEVKEKFSELSEETWQSNMYYGWLWTLKALLTSFGEGYPSFMTNEAWEDKSLSTALASWSELRHDTILYGKQSAAEGGGDWPPPVVKSYVEPNVELYQRLLWLTRYSRENLTARGILPEDLQTRMEAFEELLDFLTTCSIKELNNEALSDEEHNKLLAYGATLEFLTSSMADGGMSWFEITSETDKNMAVVADVHTTSGAYLEEAVGLAAEIFVVVPIDGELYLTRGAVFDYYEFVSETRLTDEEWQQMLKENRQPPQPEWTDSFKSGVKSKIPLPQDPYEPRMGSAVPVPSN